MSQTLADDARKYTLLYYTPDDADTGNPPFKYRSYYLADALEEAWRNHEAGGNVISIVQEQRVILSSEELLETFARMAEMIPLTPERELREIAEQVVREKGKA
ncbi:MAG: hypothetical protein ICV60_02820 [Pyrinomonadaceae bacterium]|nr:hypothetical protein [Pyrinomonadaceae bacterium]